MITYISDTSLLKYDSKTKPFYLKLTIFVVVVYCAGILFLPFVDPLLARPHQFAQCISRCLFGGDNFVHYITTSNITAIDDHDTYPGLL